MDTNTTATGDSSTQQNNEKESVFVELIGLTPEDFPEPDEGAKSKDTAAELANDIHHLIEEDYPFDIEGVATCVNGDIHERLNNALQE